MRSAGKVEQKTGRAQKTARRSRLLLTEDDRTVARLLAKLGTSSQWKHTQAREVVQAGEVFVPYERRARGKTAIATLLGIKPDQLRRLRDPKNKSYDPAIAGIIRVDDKGRVSANYTDLFCAVVRRARYKSALRSMVREQWEAK